MKKDKFKISPKRFDAKRDKDGYCTVCGLELDTYGETEKTHVCPPGFRVVTKEKKMKTKLTVANLLNKALLQLEKALIDYKKLSAKNSLSENAKLAVLRQVRELGGKVIKLGDELLKDL